MEDNMQILSEFSIPESEIDASLEVGDFGKVVIPVEVIGRIEGRIVFRKHQKAVPEGNFRKESVQEMRGRLLDKQNDDEA